MITKTVTIFISVALEPNCALGGLVLEVTFHLKLGAHGRYYSCERMIRPLQRR